MLIDISRCLGYDDITFPGDPPAVLTQTTLPLEAGGYALSRLSTSVHAGTHLDAPAHFIDGGQTIEQIPIERFSLRAHVLQITEVAAIAPQHVDLGQVQPGDAVLFKTANSNLPRDRYHSLAAWLSVELTHVLIEMGVGLVGIDHLSIEAMGDTTYPVHHKLLGAGVLILEDLNLVKVEPGTYHLYCFPIKLAKTEGAPCRAVLATQSG